MERSSEQWVGVSEAAAAVGVERREALAAIAAGRLEAERAGRAWRIRAEALRADLERRTVLSAYPPPRWAAPLGRRDHRRGRQRTRADRHGSADPHSPTRAAAFSRKSDPSRM